MTIKRIPQKSIWLMSLLIVVLVGCGKKEKSSVQSVAGNETSVVTEASNESNAAGGSLAGLVDITADNAGQLVQVGVLKGNNGGVATLEFSPDGKWFASGGPDGSVIVWDATTGTENSRWAANEGGVWAVAFSPDSNVLATGGQDSMVHLWEVATQTQISTFQSVGPVSGVAFSPDGTRIAASTFAYPTVTEIWNVATGEEVNHLTRRNIPHFEVAFSPDGNTLYSASGYGSVWIWDLATNQYVDLIGGHSRPLYDMDLSSDGKWVAMGSENRDFSVNDVATGDEIFAQGNFDGPVSGVAFNKATTLLATCGVEDLTVHVWNLTTSSEAVVLTGGTSVVGVVAFDPTSKLLVSGDGVGEIRLWGVKGE